MRPVDESAICISTAGTGESENEDSDGSGSEIIAAIITNLGAVPVAYITTRTDAKGTKSRVEAGTGTSAYIAAKYYEEGSPYQA